ncbi:MAG: hypothetical protein HY331_12840 [Chloroflexi bacterium]|nr:hypothetical protein [Chloroflexota bacterium]
MNEPVSKAYWRLLLRDQVDIRVAKSWLLITGALVLAQIRATAPAGGRSRLAKSLTNALIGTGLPLVTVALHEAGHAVVARALGWRRPVVVLDPFAATTRVVDVPQRPAQEAAFALAGVAANLLLAGIAGALARRSGDGVLGRALALGSSLNLGLAAVNAVPAPPLDGGMALRAGLWHRSKDRPLATRQSETVGGWAGLAMLAVGTLSWRRLDPESELRNWSGMLAVAGGFALLARLVGSRRRRV